MTTKIENITRWYVSNNYINLFSPCSLSETVHWPWPHCLWGESCLHSGGQAMPCSLWCLINCARFKVPSDGRCLYCLEIKFINSGYFQKTDCWHEKVLWMLITFKIRALATCVIARAFQAEQCTVAVTVATITNTVPSHRELSGYLHIYMSWPLRSCEEWHHAASIQQSGKLDNWDLTHPERYLATGTG